MTPVDPDVLQELADANHILFDHGVVDAFVLMRGHGSTAVDVTLRQAVYRAVFVEMGARMQAVAATNDGSINRACGLWLSEASSRH